MTPTSAREGVKLFEAHHGIGNILFVDAHEEVALA